MSDITSIQLKRPVRAALSILEAQLSVKQNNSKVTPSDAIWELLKKHRPDIIKMVEAAETEESQSGTDEDEEDRLKKPA